MNKNISYINQKDNILKFLIFLLIPTVLNIPLFLFKLFNDFLLIKFIIFIIFILLLYSSIKYLDQIYKNQLNNYNPRNFSQNIFSKKTLIILSLIIIILLIEYSIEYYIYTNNILSLPNNEKSIINLIYNNIILKVICILIQGPFIEEYIFRGIFFNYFFTQNTLKNNIIGILTNSFLFAFLHSSSLDFNFLPYFFGGLLLSSTYLFTKDIKYSILIHFIRNLLSFI